MKECLEGTIILCNESCKVLVILKQQQESISSSSFAFRVTCYVLYQFVAIEKLHTHSLIIGLTFELDKVSTNI